MVRIGISFAVGLAAYLCVPGRFPMAVSTLIGWDMGALALLALSWGGISRADAEATRQRAGSEDPGRTLVYVIVVLTSSVSLLAATLLLRNTNALPPEFAGGIAGLCLVTVALAWTTTHAAFTFRYAHLYYREDSDSIILAFVLNLVFGAAR